ncbi:MAG: TonB-dependent receptor [Burkholderiales bacterium]|nr:TonB-dependent receptor [Burkholderiales bacterium]
MRAQEATTLELERLLAQPVYGSARSAGAAKYEQDLALAPAAVTVRTAGEIRDQGYRTLAEVLASIPGVHLRYDRAYTYVGARGFERPGDYSSRLLLLIDGLRVNDNIFDQAVAGREFPLDVNLIDRVEFIPGPGSALYGSNALLGVVNVITKKPSQEPGAYAAGEWGSAGARKLFGSWGGSIGPARALLGATTERRPGRDLYFPEYDQPENNNGIARGRDAESNDKLYAKVVAGDWVLTGLVSDRRKLLPTGAYDAAFNTPNQWSDRYVFLDAAFSRRLGEAHELQVRLGAARYDYNGVSQIGTAPDISSSHNPTQGRWVSGELRYTYLGFARHRLLAGVEYQDNLRQFQRVEYTAPVPEVFLDVDGRSRRHALYLNDEWSVGDGLQLHLGVRADRQLDGNGRVSPRAAAVWSPLPQWIFKALVGEAFREPNAYERQYFDDAAQKVNPALSAEQLRSGELSAVWQGDAALSVRASLYRFRMERLIDLVEQSDGLLMYENVGAARSRGLEVEATALLPHGALLRGSWSRQQTVDAASGAALTDAPRSLVKLAWTTPAFWADTRLGLHADRVGRRVTVARASLPPRTLLHANLGYEPPGSGWSFALGVHNLTDRRHADPGGPELVQDSVPQDGRQWRLRVGRRF